MTSGGIRPCDLKTTQQASTCSADIANLYWTITIGKNTDTGTWPAGTTFTFTIYSVKISLTESAEKYKIQPGFTASSRFITDEIIDQTNTNAGKVILV